MTLPTPVNVAGARIRRIIYGTAAAGSMVLVVRALLTEESQALRALKRVVFAVDSLDVRSEPTKQGEFLADLREEAAADPQCDAVLSTHSQQLE